MDGDGCVLTVAGSQNGWVDVGAVQPTSGDDVVGGFRHVDSVPTHVSRGIWAHGRPILVALGVQVEVVFAHSGGPATSSQGSIFESCGSHTPHEEGPNTSPVITFRNL